MTMRRTLFAGLGALLLGTPAFAQTSYSSEADVVAAVRNAAKGDNESPTAFGIILYSGRNASGEAQLQDLFTTNGGIVEQVETSNGKLFSSLSDLQRSNAFRRAQRDLGRSPAGSRILAYELEGDNDIVKGHEWNGSNFEYAVSMQGPNQVILLGDVATEQAAVSALLRSSHGKRDFAFSDAPQVYSFACVADKSDATLKDTLVAHAPQANGNIYKSHSDARRSQQFRDAKSACSGEMVIYEIDVANHDITTILTTGSRPDSLADLTGEFGYTSLTVVDSGGSGAGTGVGGGNGAITVRGIVDSFGTDHRTSSDSWTSEAEYVEALLETAHKPGRIARANRKWKRIYGIVDLPPGTIGAVEGVATLEAMFTSAVPKEDMSGIETTFYLNKDDAVAATQSGQAVYEIQYGEFTNLFDQEGSFVATLIGDDEVHPRWFSDEAGIIAYTKSRVQGTDADVAYQLVVFNTANREYSVRQACDPQLYDMVLHPEESDHQLFATLEEAAAYPRISDMAREVNRVYSPDNNDYWVGVLEMRGGDFVAFYDTTDVSAPIFNLEGEGVVQDLTAGSP